jgi:N-acetylglucosamine-6-phosphate deacetylase
LILRVKPSSFQGGRFLIRLGNRHEVMQARVTDVHIHGVEGLDTTTEEVENITRLAEIEGRAGVEGIVLSIFSGPLEVMRRQMATIRRAVEVQNESSLPFGDVLPPARILGVHLEGPFLNPAMAGALDGSSFANPSEPMFRDLTDGFEDLVRIVTIAPEKGDALGLIRFMVKRGILVNMGHSNATITEAEAGFRAGARGVTHLFNAMSAFSHREAGLPGFGLLNPEVYVEVIGDLIHLSREALELVFRVKSPERIILVSDSVRETSLVGDSSPQRSDGRLLGGSAPLPLAARRLVAEGFDPGLVMRAISINPRAYLASL